MAQAHGVPQVETVILLLARPEKAVENTQAFMGVQGPGSAVQLAQVFRQVRVYPAEKGAGLLHILPGGTDGDVLVLHQVIAARGFIHKDGVILPAV